MHRFLLLLLAVVAVGVELMAGDVVVRGRVVFATDDEPLPGATVMPVGDGRGTVTDAEGVFSLSVPSTVGKITVSYIGMADSQVDITPGVMMHIALSPSETMLDEVVVTALGMKRERKGLGYAVQDLKADRLNTSGTTSLADAMQGRLSGVDIRPSSGAPGAPANITIRGVRSFSDNNSPLYVIDGMPVESTPDVVQTANNMTRNASYSDRSIDINPDDIESISVLKGQAAAALYGMRASNGVILITTRRGGDMETSRPVITVSTDIASVRVSRKFRHQDVYAQGTAGRYDPTSAMTWGPKIADLPDDATYGGNTDNKYTQMYGRHEGMYYNPKRAQAGLDGWTVPQVYDNTGDFFANGFTENANFAISRHSERASYSFGLSNSHQEGVVRNTGLNRWGARGALDYVIDAQWKGGFSANYVHNNINTAPQANSAIVNMVYSAPAEYDLKGIPSSVPGDPTRQVLFGPLTYNNPYWWAENNAYTQSTQRFYGNAYVEYRPSLGADGLELVLREQLGVDAYTSRYGNIQELGSAGNTSGYVENSSYTRQVFNNLFTADFRAVFGNQGEWNVGLLAGCEVNNDRLVSSSYVGTGLAFYGQPVIGNCSSLINAAEAPSQDRTVGLFFNAMASWRDMLFVSVTGRGDRVSGMPRGNRTFFYPSVSGAWVFTELGALRGNRVLTFGKLRFSYAEVGQPGDYVRNFAHTPTYGGGFYTFYPVNYPVGGQTSFVPYSKEYDPTLRPQTTRNYEAGADVRLMDNRLRVEYTYSCQDVRDQIFEIPLDGSTGYRSVISNGGRITTVTHELSASVMAYNTRDISVDFGVNWTRCRSMVKELAPGVDNIKLGGFTQPQVRASAGYSYPVIFGNSFMRDEATGQLLLDASGLPVTDGRSVVIGECTPDFNMGFNLDLRYRRLSLSSTWSWQKGGEMYHGSYGSMQRFGATRESAANRDEPLHVTGIDYDTREPVEYDVDRYKWNNIYYNVSEAYVVDTDFVKLRDVTLTYRLPRIGRFDISVYGFARNVLVWAKMDDFDPESSLGNNNAGGYFERFSLPATASFGGGLKLTL